MARTLTYMKAITEAIAQEMERDPKVVVMAIDARASTFGQTLGLVDKFGPDRVINTPISEAAFTGAAMGMAETGMRPVVDLLHSEFTLLPMNHLCIEAAQQHYYSGGQVSFPMVVCSLVGTFGGLVGSHSQSPEVSFVNFPGLKVIVPSTPYDMKGLLKSAIRDNNLVMSFEHKLLFGMEGEVPEDDYTIPLGQAVVRREGKHATVVATLLMVHKAMKAAEMLSQEGIEIEVIDPRTLAPLDEDTIFQSVRKTGRLITVEESRLRCGIGAEISALVAEKAFDYLDAPLQRIAGPMIPVGAGLAFKEYFIPSEEDIVRAVKKVVG